MSIEALTLTPPKPLLRGVFHEVAVFFAAIAGIFLVLAASSPAARIACVVYALSLTTLLGVSALYHRVNWAPEARQRMRRLDHSAIFVLIAGTWTPLALTLEAHSMQRMLTVAWLGAAVGVLKALFWVHAPKWVVAVLALIMGWLSVLYLPDLYRSTGPVVIAWMGIGGVLYSLGAIFYAVKRPNPWPNVLGYHELFHALVIAAAGCHFVAVSTALPMISG